VCRLWILRGNYKSKICIQYSTDNEGFTYKTYGETLYCIDFPTISINFIRIWGDFRVNFKVITCNAYIFFSYNIYLCSTYVRTYGDFRRCVIPIPITCILQGTPCDTGIPNTFYRQNICSVRWGCESEVPFRFREYCFEVPQRGCRGVSKHCSV
jgi:hypothetical protein